MNADAAPVVAGVSRDDDHRYRKNPQGSISLVAGHGVEGDAHAGTTVQHRYLAWKDPQRRNLRQVHLLPAEFLDEIAKHGFALGPGDFGENVLTRGLDLRSLPTGTRLALGADAVVVLTGLRDPCRLIDDAFPGLQQLAYDTGPDGQPRRRAGVMSVVDQGGVVRPGDRITVTLPTSPHTALGVV